MGDFLGVSYNGTELRVKDETAREDIESLQEQVEQLNDDLTNGSVTKVGTATVGGTAKPIYLNAGTPTALSGTAGGTAKPVYLNAGTIQALSGTAGGTAKPVYLNAGTIQALSGTVGSSSKPVYLNAGTITQCSGIHILSITDVNNNCGSTTASGSTAEWTWTITAVSGATGYIVIPYACTWGGVVESCSVSGTTVTVSVRALYETHTLTVRYKVIAYA